MKSMKISEEYRILLESLEIPVQPLGPRSQRTPEWELLKDIKERFGVPAEIETLNPLSDYLTDNVSLDDFFTFLGYLIHPFARMVVDIYDFLSQHQRTATSPQTISEIRIGSQTAFPVDFSHMPHEWLKILAEIHIPIWNLDALWSLTNYLPPLRYIAICDGRFDDRVCRPASFQQCRTAISDIVKDIETILQANADIEKMIKITGMDNVIFQMTNIEKRSKKSVARLPKQLVEIMQSFLDVYRGLESGFGKSASDCIAGQRNRVPTNSLYTQREIAHVCEIIDRARLTQKIRTETLKKFLKLPYWRRRNDLYEVWVLTKACSQFPHLYIQLCNVDSGGHWNIPGNGQGKIIEPVLRLSAPSGKYQVFTGLKLKGFQFPFEEARRVTGAMPDWLFCREIIDATEFDFSLLVDEGKRFEEHGLIPELIIECKAGASYGLLRTILNPMVRRYLPLLRTERGKALLVNYRQFNTPQELNVYPQLRDSLRHRYTQILVIDPLVPGQKEVEEEFLQTIRGTFGLANKSSIGPKNLLDLMLVFDTTGSMRSHLQSVREQLAQVVNTLRREIEDLRVGIIAVGDHCDEPLLYAVKLHPLGSKTDEAVSFIQTVPETAGGDEAEAYEDALHVLAALPWRAVAQKVVVLIGDAYPHSAEECPKGLDWKEQISHLERQEVAIYGIRLSDNSASESFFVHACSETGGEHIQADSNSDILKIILNYIKSHVNIIHDNIRGAIGLS